MRGGKVWKVFGDRRSRAVGLACVILAAFFILLQPLAAVGKAGAEPEPDAHAEEVYFEDEGIELELVTGFGVIWLIQNNIITKIIVSPLFSPEYRFSPIYFPLKNNLGSATISIMEVMKYEGIWRTVKNSTPSA